MKIRSLSRFVLASTMFASFTASAVPGLWQQGYGQGNAEYSVTDASGKMFIINCTGNPDQNGFYQHSVFLTQTDNRMVSSHDDGTTITVVMNHQQYVIPSSFFSTPRPRLRNFCNSVVARWSASSWVGAATTLTQIMT